MFELLFYCTITISKVTFYSTKVLVEKSFFYTIFIVFAAVFSVQAQKFDRITLDDGLSQSNINCFAQDRIGFLWIGTNGGLNRYDGSEFKVFLHDLNDSLSISNNVINTIFEDEDGLLWIGTQNGLNIYNRRSNKFTIYRSEKNNSNSISSNVITAIVEDTLGNYWIGTDGGGLNKFDPVNKEFEHFQYQAKNPYSISSNSISSLCLDKYGFVWVGTKDQGVNMLNPANEKFVRYLANDENDHQISDNKVNTIYQDNDGVLWVGTDKGLNQFNEQNNKRSLGSRDEIIQYQYDGNINSIGGESVLSIYQGASGLIWIGTNNGGLTSLNKELGYFKNYQIDPNKQEGLLSNKITAIFDDRSEILWIGTNAGINKIDRQGDRFKLHVRKQGAENTWSSNNVRSIFKEENGITWVGTFDAGLNKYDPHTGEFTIYKDNDIILAGISIEEHKKILRKNNRKSKRFKDKDKYLTNNRILSVHRDDNKNLWIGTGGGGLNKLDLKTEKITWYLSNPEDTNSLSNDIVKVIFESSDGLLWIGTEGGGLNKFNGEKFVSFKHNENDTLSISSNVITSIAEDLDGNLWIGTFGGGLNKFDKTSGTFKRFTIQENRGGISSNTVYCLYRDENNKLWIGTNDGLNLLDVESETFKHYTVHNNLPSNFIYGVLDDNKGNLWLSTNRGISKFDIENEVAKNYDKLDGLQGNEFNPGAYFKTNSGEMLFGGINGFNSFYPRKIKDNTYQPDVILTDFKIFGESAEIGAPNSPLQIHVSEQKQLELSYKDKAIQFEFVALNYTNSEKNEYAYILENFEKKWNYVGTRRFASYTNLPPGEYVFRVKASNNDNIWNEDGTSIVIKINPPFYRTWWFYLIVIVSALASGYIFVLIRIRNLQKTKTLLRKIVKARTRQLYEEKERVEKAHSEILWQKNEIENQKNLLIKNNKELSSAKQQIDFTNKELKQINTNLENIVLERTEKLRRAYENLKIANNELDLFIYRASHDLKGPIASLLGLTQIARLDEIPENTSNYIDKIELGATNLNRVLTKLTDIHFINKSELELVEIPIADFVDDIIKNIRPQEKNNIVISNSILKNVLLKCDSKLLYIILTNIIENALVFKKRANCYLNIQSVQTRNSFDLIFEDNGIGIPDEYHNKVFNMFCRASEMSKGSGLGLYLVNKASEKLVCNIGIESAFGRFTKLTISFNKNLISKSSGKQKVKDTKEPAFV